MGRLVLDASAVIAYFRGEPGQEAVATALESECCISAAQWAEVAGHFCQETSTWAMAAAVLAHHGVVVEPVLADDGARAGLMRRTHPSLSLGDRLCLATAERLGSEVLTADRAWGNEAPIRQIR